MLYGDIYAEFLQPAAQVAIEAEVPALHLADYGADVPEALNRLHAMLTFHLDCLRKEGKLFPADLEGQEGFFLRVNLPAYAA